VGGTYFTGDVHTAASASRADVQSAIDAASNLDTVRLPASATATWDSVVTINAKAIKLDGNGSTITRGTIADNAPMLTLTAHASMKSRITNFNFEYNTSRVNGFYIRVNSDEDDESAALWRIDNCDFQSQDLGTCIKVFGAGHGLIDNCQFYFDGNEEAVHVTGYGSGDTQGWTNVNGDVFPGTERATYMEDCLFYNERVGNFAAGKTAAFWGSRNVIRFCEYHNAQIDQHGTDGEIGARWWELYYNYFSMSASDNVDKFLQIRGGTGYIFANTSDGVGGGNQAIVLWEEDSGYPASYQIGRGKNQTLVPTYIWLKDSDMPFGVSECDGACPGEQIVPNRDYYLETGSFNGTSGMGVGTIANRPSTCTTGVAYWATDEGSWRAGYPGTSGRLYIATATNTWTLSYTPYTYPHPLRSNMD